FEAVKSGEANFGVIPLENSLMGSIHQNYDLLLEYDLPIIGELRLRIIHNLIGHPGARLEDVRRVLGPSPALQQCTQFLETAGDWIQVPVSDTASAVKTIAEGGERTDAAIGSKAAAEVYGMEVIEESVETNPRNYTRFVIISAEPLENGRREKSALVFATDHQPGALFETLKVIAENGINLVKLESRPIHGKPWEYM
ncbi:MAG: phospho-2-dehydro-3-deoxyheptonate aldolase, partial [Desulfobacterales bacterium]|nr:phospho-2-dehydro-3-deoxyheptonate aldolase [Desulfobacterales bacterium]